MSPLDLLGLPSDADATAVKRVYAQQLRVTRPDEDPEGFQRLHAAYKAALEFCRQQQPDETARWYEPEINAQPYKPSEPPALSTAPVEATYTSDAIEPPAESRFDADAFCIAAFELASAGDAAVLQAWLAGQHDLWSLQLKTRTGQYLVEKLHQQAPPMPAKCMDVLLRFFNRDQALTMQDPLAMVKLRRRMQLAWQLESSDEESLGARLAIRTPLERWHAHWIVRQLQRPFQWPRVLWLGINFVKAQRIADFIDEVSDHHPTDLPDTIDRRQVDFWLAASDRQRVASPRLLLGGIRSAAMLLLSILLAPLLSLLYTSSISLQPMLITVGVLMVPSALWAIWVMWTSLIFWYLTRETPQPLRSVLTYLVPTLCASGVALGAWGQDGFGMFLLLAALWLAARRYWYRQASRYALLNSGYVRLMFLAAIPMLHGVLNASLGSNLVSINEVIAAAAMLAWALELTRQLPARASLS